MGLTKKKRNLLIDLFGKETVQDADYERRGFHLMLSLSPEELIPLSRNMQEMGFVLEYMTAVDRTTHLELVYMFGTFDSPHRVKVQVDTAGGEMVPSLVDFFRAADWHEREVYDMFGQTFSGRDRIKRILLPDDADYHPLLKDFISPESDFNEAFDSDE